MALQVQGVLHEDSRVWFIDELTNKIARVVDLAAGPFDESGINVVGTKCHIMARRLSDGKPVAYTDIVGTFQTVPVFNITNDQDDGYCDIEALYYFVNDARVYINTYGGLVNTRAFFRFENVSILNAQAISSAFLRVVGASNSSGSSSTVRLRGVNLDHAPVITDATQLMGLALTSAYVDYSYTATVLDTAYDITGLGPIISEIVSREGWAIGNSLCIIAQHLTNSLSFQAVNLASELHLTY